MRSLGKMAVGVVILCGAAFPVGAQDKEARAIIDKAVKAHGGADKLAKFPAAHFKGKGSVEVMGMNVKFTLELHSHYPDKSRTTIEVDVAGMTISVVNVYDGKKAWESIMGTVKEVTDAKKLDNMKKEQYIQGITALQNVTGKEIELSQLGDLKVKDQDTVGVRVSSKDRPDVSLYFNKKTNLLAKAEYRTLDDTLNEVNREVYLSDYKEKDGLPTAFRMILHHDGKMFMAFEVSEVKHLEKLDAAMFVKP